MTILLIVVAWLLTYLLHSTLLLGGALGLAHFRVVRTPAARDTLWKVALIGGVLTATAQLALRVEPVTGHVALYSAPESGLVDVASVRPALAVVGEPGPAAEESGAAEFKSASDGAAPVTGTESARVTTLLSGVRITWPGVLLYFWLVGAAAFGTRLLWLHFRLSRTLYGRRPVTEGPLAETLALMAWEAGVAAPRLSVSDQLRGPIAFGNEIVVPSRVERYMDRPAQRAVLAHELGHVVRRDPRWLVAASLIETVLFMQPLNSYARRRIQETSEFLSDEWAAERTGGLVLARCLAEVAEWMQASPSPAPVAGMAEQGSQLVTRVERLLAGSHSVPSPGAWVLRTALAIAVVTGVAWAAPGVATQDLGALEHALAAPEFSVTPVEHVAWEGGEGWATVRSDGRVLALAPGWTARISGSGRLSFRQWGRVFVLPDNWRMEAGGSIIDSDQELCEDEANSVRFVGPDGSWTLTPVRAAGARAYAAYPDRDQRRDYSRDAESSLEQRLETAVEIQLDAAIDSVVEIWQRDPAAASRAARRLARTWERDLKPEFERLGVALGNELAPQLARVTSRTVQDLTPEFERLGAALGETIVSALNEAASELEAARPATRRSRKDK